jgi:hypothetical protein
MSHAMSLLFPPVSIVLVSVVIIVSITGISFLASFFHFSFLYISMDNVFTASPCLVVTKVTNTISRSHKKN